MKVIDLHCDTIGEIQAGENLLKGSPQAYVDIPSMRSGNAGVVRLPDLRVRGAVERGCDLR